MNYDVIIPVTVRNLVTLPKVVENINLYVEHEHIIVIGNGDIEEKVNNLNICFINEDELLQNLSFERIKGLIQHRDCYAVKRTGWYFQQFIKIAYSYVCEKEWYLVWDADTIPLRTIEMFDEDGKAFFDIKDEYNAPYFTTIKKLFDGDVVRYNDYSFISEHMIIKCEYVKKMIDLIYEKKGKSNDLFEIILNTVNSIDLLESGFSEFETYGNYVNCFYPNAYKVRRLSSFRNGEKEYGRYGNEVNLSEAALKYDIITFENR